MRKVYKAKSHVSINVVLSSKGNMHISFSPLSNGDSTYCTDNEEVQRAIEKNANFGRLFFLYSCEDECNAEKDDTIATSGAEGEKEEVKKIQVNDLSEAREILADRYGVSRTFLRGEKSIKENAQRLGIKFEGLE